MHIPTPMYDGDVSSYDDFLEMVQDLLETHRVWGHTFTSFDNPLTRTIGFQLDQGGRVEIDLRHLKESLYRAGTSDDLRAILYRSYVGSVEGRKLLAEHFSRGTEPVTAMPV